MQKQKLDLSKNRNKLTRDIVQRNLAKIPKKKSRNFPPVFKTVSPNLGFGDSLEGSYSLLRDQQKFYQKNNSANRYESLEGSENLSSVINNDTFTMTQSGEHFWKYLPDGYSES